MKAINTNQAKSIAAEHSIYMYGNGAEGLFIGKSLDGNGKCGALSVILVEYSKSYESLPSKDVEWNKSYRSLLSKDVEGGKSYGSFHAKDVEGSKSYGSLLAKDVEWSKSHGSLLSKDVECSKSYGSRFSKFEKGNPSLLENDSRILNINLSNSTIIN